LKRYSNIIFDCDGTLLDTQEGILASVGYTIDTLRLKPLTPVEMRTFLGPPLKESYGHYYPVEEPSLSTFIRTYRNHYTAHGLLLAALYPGIASLLDYLSQNTYALGVATNKRQDHIEKLLEHFDIARHFAAICGTDVASTKTKRDVLKDCLSLLSDTHTSCVLIGDSTHDAVGARQLDMDFIAVTYGYGFKTRLEAATFNPVYVCDSVEELTSLLCSRL
jgi:phosphoglycolate phosphatase